MDVLYFLSVSLIFNLGMFLLAYIFKTDILTDLSYAATFFFLSILAFGYSSQSFVQTILLIMVILWSLRIGIYLFTRIIRMKSDSRFDGIRDSFSSFALFWFFQALTVWVILLPTLYVFERSSYLRGVSYLGMIIFAIGLIIETVADYQKYQFKNNNPKGFISSGLWAYSRHPNYFGEILCWIGIYIFAFPHMLFFHKILALLSPLYIISILCFFSGIPPLEKRYNERYARNKQYQQYKQSTSLLIPWPKK